MWGGIFVICISSVLTNCTVISDIYGGGGKLGGGSYLICLYIGMVLGKYYKEIQAWLNNYSVCVGFILSSTIAILSWRLLCVKGFIFDRFGIFGEGINPPGLHLLLYSVSIMMSIFFGEKLFSSFFVTDCIIKELTHIGRHTLYIFLYHRLFLDYLRAELYDIRISKIMGMIIYYFSMIGGSLFIEIVCKKVWKYILKSYE